MRKRTGLVVGLVGLFVGSLVLTLSLDFTFANPPPRSSFFDDEEPEEQLDYGDGTPEPAPPTSEGQVGEIRHSILTEEQFRALYGDSWVLMDGRNIVGTDLQRQFGWSRLPDARGMFLRGKNHGRGGSGNPDGNLELGQAQGDMVGSHSHSVTVNYQNNGNDQPFRITGEDGHGHERWVWEYPTSATGGNETRSRNITVNIFIKVNRTPYSRFERQVLWEVQRLPRRIVDSPAFSRAIQELVDRKVEQALRAREIRQ